MPFIREHAVKNITDNLAFLFVSTQMENVLGLFDSNRGAQHFFCGLFSLVFGYANLQDLDKVNGVTNYPAIDLGDATRKVSIQVTVDGSSQKIKATIKKFIAHGQQATYERLIIFIIGQKPGYTTSFDTDSVFVFNQETDILDGNDLIKAIDLLDTEALEKVEQFLIKELQDYKSPDRLYDIDIKTCVMLLKERLGDILLEVTSDTTPKTPIRTDDYLERKNRTNNVSEKFSRDNIVGHLHFNDTIFKFLQDPINQEVQRDYFSVTSTIQKYYSEHKTSLASFEQLFSKVFEIIKYQYNDSVSPNKIKIVLHNMYFNCDIGQNPD